jgi:hypothetical protein
VTRNGNPSVTSTRTKNFSSTSVLRLVKVKITSTILPVPFKAEGRTSTPVSEALRPYASATAA